MLSADAGVRTIAGAMKFAVPSFSSVAAAPASAVSAADVSVRVGPVLAARTALCAA